MSVSLRDLRSFVAIAEHRSLTQAARELNYSQPAISLHLRTLERDLGCALFTRVPGGVEITPEGARVLDVALEIMRLCARVALPQQRHGTASDPSLVAQHTGSCQHVRAAGTALSPVAPTAGL